MVIHTYVRTALCATQRKGQQFQIFTIVYVYFYGEGNNKMRNETFFILKSLHPMWLAVNHFSTTPYSNKATITTTHLGY